MSTIATNIRFPQEEYETIKTLAFVQKKSTAEVIREAVRQYSRTTSRSPQSKVNLVEKLRKMAIKIDIPVVNLVKAGRKFE